MRTYKVSPQYRCARCGCVVSLSDCIWQMGLLVCKKHDCQDRRLLGQTDSEVAHGLEAWALSDEGQPDRKLTEPVVANSVDDIIF